MATTDDSASWDSQWHHVASSSIYTTRTEIHEHTGFEALVAVLREPGAHVDDERKTLAMRWLFRHAYCRANREALRECGALDALQLVLETSDVLETTLRARFTLDTLAVKTERDVKDFRRARRTLANDATSADYARLSAALHANATGDDRTAALETLFCLAEVLPSAPQLAEFVPRVVAHLNNSYSLVGVAAALAVVAFAECHAAALLDHGVVLLLVDLIIKGGPQHKERATEALSALLAVNICKEAVTKRLVALNATVLLVELVRSGIGEQRAKAACALGNTARGLGDGHRAVVEAGAIQPLLNLVRHGDDKESCIAGTVIFDISFCREWPPLVAAGVDAAIVDMLRSTAHAHRPCAAKVVADLAKGNHVIQSSFAQAGVFEPLLEMLRSGTAPEKGAAGNAIFHLVEQHDGNKALVIDGGVIPLLLAIVRDGPRKSTAMRALTILAQNNALAKLRLVQAGALQPIVALLREGDNVEKLDAANALALIAENNESYVVEITLLGAVKPLLMNLEASRAGSENDAKAALYALSCLTTCQTARTQMLALNIGNLLNDVESQWSELSSLVKYVRAKLELRGPASAGGDACQIPVM